MSISINPASFFIWLMASTLKPSIPLSSHQFIILYISCLTSSLSQFKSGCLLLNRCKKYCSVFSSYCHADPLNILSQLLGSAPSFPSLQIYQSLFLLSFESFDSINQGCSSLVWLITKSIISFIPLLCTSSSIKSKSSIFPKSSIISW